MIKAETVGVVDGDDVEVGKVFGQGIQLFNGRVIRISVFQHGDHVVHRRDVGGERTDIFIDFLSLACDRREQGDT